MIIVKLEGLYNLSLKMKGGQVDKGSGADKEAAALVNLTVRFFVGVPAKEGLKEDGEVPLRRLWGISQCLLDV